MPVEETDVAVGARGAGLERARFTNPCGLSREDIYFESRGTAEWRSGWAWIVVGGSSRLCTETICLQKRAEAKGVWH